MKKQYKLAPVKNTLDPVIEYDPDLKTCPSCKREIPRDLVMCWNCGNFFKEMS